MTAQVYLRRHEIPDCIQFAKCALAGFTRATLGRQRADPDYKGDGASARVLVMRMWMAAQHSVTPAETDDRTIFEQSCGTILWSAFTNVPVLLSSSVIRPSDQPSFSSTKKYVAGTSPNPRCWRRARPVHRYARAAHERPLPAVVHRC